MINVVSWNVGKHKAPWRELVRMTGDGDADVALVQEAGSPPGDVVDLVGDDDHVFWNRHVYDRWPLVVQLSDSNHGQVVPARPADQRPRGGPPSASVASASSPPRK